MRHGHQVAPIIFSTINVDASYWASAFLVMIFIGRSIVYSSRQPAEPFLTVGADAVYPVGNLQIISHFNDDSQSLAGGIFNVATRVSYIPDTAASVSSLSVSSSVHLLA